MSLAPASAPQLDLFVSSSAAYEAALARYEALRPVLTGERSLRQQSQHIGVNYWRLWRDLRRFQREGLLGLLDQRTLPHPRGKAPIEALLPTHIQQQIIRLAIVHRLRYASWHRLSGTATTCRSITVGSTVC
jgi:hypothetical protein